jgi:hypothetical protein
MALVFFTVPVCIYYFVKLIAVLVFCVSKRVEGLSLCFRDEAIRHHFASLKRLLTLALRARSLRRHAADGSPEPEG